MLSDISVIADLWEHNMPTHTKSVEKEGSTLHSLSGAVWLVREGAISEPRQLSDFHGGV